MMAPPRHPPRYRLMKFVLYLFLATFIVAQVIPRALNGSKPAPLVISFDVEVLPLIELVATLLELVKNVLDTVINTGVDAINAGADAIDAIVNPQHQQQNQPNEAQNQKRGIIFGKNGVANTVWKIVFGWTGLPDPWNPPQQQQQPPPQPQPTTSRAPQPQPTTSKQPQPQPTTSKAPNPQPTTSPDNTAVAGLDMNLKGVYYMVVKGGLQKLLFKALIDTGSSDMWVKQAVFDPAQSLSGRVTSTPYGVQYQGTLGSSLGVWAYDDFSIGNVDLTNFQFALIKELNHYDDALIGVGKKDLEQTQNKYDNLPWALKAQNKISKAAYSLYLNTAKAATGSILFGGVDHAKYQGDLVTLKSEGARLWGQLDSVLIAGQEMPLNQQVAWDCGFTLTVLPENFVKTMLAHYTGVQRSGTNYIVDCNQDTSKKIAFKFGQGTAKQTTVEFGLDRFMWLYNDLCVFGAKVQNALANFPDMVLGASFLRNAYTVFDLEDNTIQVAPVKYTTDSDIQVL